MDRVRGPAVPPVDLGLAAQRTGEIEINDARGDEDVAPVSVCVAVTPAVPPATEGGRAADGRGRIKLRPDTANDGWRL